MKRIGTGALLVILAATIGCSSPAYKDAILARAKSLRTAPEYRIGEGDTVTINVLGEADRLITARVRSDGKVSFPEHGDIAVAGKTTEELRTQLQGEFTKTLQLTSPKVHVAVTTFDSKNVAILGEVVRPGRFPYTGQMRVVDLVSMAIGATIYASRQKALLFREIDGATKVYHIHMRDFFHRNDFSTNFYLRPGDIIYVPSRPAKRIGDNIRVIGDPLRAISETIGFGSRTVTVFTGSP